MRQYNGNHLPLEPGHPDCCAAGHWESDPDVDCPACRATILELESDFAREREDCGHGNFDGEPGTACQDCGAVSVQTRLGSVLTHDEEV